MRRVLAIAVALCAAVLAAGLAWLWWTAPPRVDRGELEAALAAAPEAATGVVAAPLARGWLLRHPQVAILGALAAPSAWPRAESLGPAARALAEAADGPVVAWWNDDGVALAALVDPSYVDGLRTVAAMGGVVWRQRPGPSGTVVVMASADAVAEPRPWPRPAVTGERLAALARLPSGTWRARAGRSWFEAWRGEAPGLAPATEPSRIATGDLGALLRPAGVAPSGSVTAAVAVFSAREGWGLRIQDGGIRRWLGRLGAPTGGDVPQRWDGVLGSIWVDPATDAVASSAAMLTAVEAPRLPGEAYGSMSGPDAAWVLGRLRGLLRRLPVAAVRERDLARAADLLEPLAHLRWAADSAGSRIRVEW